MTQAATQTPIAKRGRGRPYPPTPLQSADPQDILKRYLNDERTQDIAASFGVTRKALNHYLLTNAEDAWRAAQVAKASGVKDEADDFLSSLQARIEAFKDIEDKDERQTEIEACRQLLPLARERARRAEWELERLLSRIYGNKPEVQVNIGSSLISILGSIPHNSHTQEPRIINADDATD